MSNNKDNEAKINFQDNLAGKYLTFRLGDEIYALEILKVQEIIGLMKVTHVPRTPEFIRGVINLRGKVIPVIDLRLKFDSTNLVDTDRTCIIVVQLNAGSESIIMGIIVDEVSEVVDITSDQIEEPPTFGDSVNTEFIMGMGKFEQKVIMLLDIEKVLTKDEISSASALF
jgi:purine-binding chemotaxis protein CheW